MDESKFDPQTNVMLCKQLNVLIHSEHMISISLFMNAVSLFDLIDNEFLTSAIILIFEHDSEYYMYICLYIHQTE